MIQAKVTVRLKNGVLDPQGKAILNAAHALGFAACHDVKVGKVFFVEIEGTDSKAAQEGLKQLADKLLANTVIEDFAVEII